MRRAESSRVKGHADMRSGVGGNGARGGGVGGGGAGGSGVRLGSRQRHKTFTPEEQDCRTQSLTLRDAANIERARRERAFSFENLETLRDINARLVDDIMRRDLEQQGGDGSGDDLDDGVGEDAGGGSAGGGASAGAAAGARGGVGRVAALARNDSRLSVSSCPSLEGSRVDIDAADGEEEDA